MKRRFSDLKACADECAVLVENADAVATKEPSNADKANGTKHLALVMLIILLGSLFDFLTVVFFSP